MIWNDKLQAWVDTSDVDHPGDIVGPEGLAKEDGEEVFAIYWDDYQKAWVRISNDDHPADMVGPEGFAK